MAETKTCPQCGRTLAADAPAGLCPDCLLAQGLESHDSLAGEGRSEPGGRASATTPQPAGFVPPEPAELAKRFPQLEIIELLGHGGMGAVYKCRQLKLDRTVALKIIRPEAAHDAAFAERFSREARTLARLTHPHIVTVHDFGDVPAAADSDEPAGTLYYFIMEYVDGVNLRQMLAAGQLEPAAALAIVPQICEALQYAHDAGFVHRDIKPENILVELRPKKDRKRGLTPFSVCVKIADFGLAKLAAPSADEMTLTGTHQVMGTPRYMAPEQMEGSHAVDHRADIYSLGVVFYEMLTGELPMGRFDPPSKKVQIDVRLDEVVLRSLAKEPERRYQQASQVKTDVESVSSTSMPAPETRTRGGSQQAALPNEAIESARRQVARPATALFVSGIVNSVAILLAVAATFLLVWMIGGERAWNDFLEEATAGVVVLGLTGLALAGVVMFAALKMKRLEMYWLAVVAALLAMLLPPGNLIGLPCGIWALVVLSSADVRAAFRRSLLGDMSREAIHRSRRAMRQASQGFGRDDMADSLVMEGSSRASDPDPLESAEQVRAPLTIPQKIVVALALCVVLLMVLIPPWVLQFSGGQTRQYYYCLVFMPPDGYFSTSTGVEQPTAQRLALGTLALQFLAVGVITGGLFWLFQSPQARRAPKNREWLGWIAVISLPVLLTLGPQAFSSIMETLAEQSTDGSNVRADSSATDEMMDAARRGQLSRLLATGANVNDKDADGETALMKAAAGGQAAMTTSLILLGANGNERDLLGRTPLMHAAENGHAAVIESMYELEQALAVIRREVDDDRDGPSFIEEHLLSNAEQEAARQERARRPPLDPLAMLKERLHGVDVRLFEDIGVRLPEFEVNTAAQDHRGETALMKTAARGHIEAGLALRGWEDEQTQDHQGRTALFHAVENDQVDFLQAMKKSPTTGMGTSVGNYQCHQMLSPETMAVKNKSGLTAFQVAQRRGNLEMIDFLTAEADRAIDHFTRAIEAGGIYEFIYFENRAWSYQALGETENAAADLKEADTRRAAELKRQNDDSSGELGRDDDESAMESNSVSSSAPPPPEQDAAALWDAVLKGKVTLVKQLLDAGVDVNAKDTGWQTPLVKAAAAGDARTVAVLMLRGADEVARDNSGQTPLMHAVVHGQTGVVAFLLEMINVEYDEDLQFRLSRIDPESTIDADFRSFRFDPGVKLQDDRGETALMKAAARGDSKMCELLRNTSEPKTQDKSGKTALTHALENNHELFLISQLDIADAWLFNSNGALVNFSFSGLVQPETLALADDTGRTPLQLAQELKMETLTERLHVYCRAVIDRTTRDIVSGHPFAWLSFHYRAQLHLALGEHERAESDFAHARRLQAAGKDPAAIRTVALQEAVRTGDAAQVKDLLEAGVSLNDKDADGQTPLMKAAAAGHVSLCQMLLLLGANAAEQDAEGRTAVMHAVLGGHETVIRGLFQLEYLTRSADADGLRRELSLDWMLLADVDLSEKWTLNLALDSQDTKGETALIKAAAGGDIPCARALLGGTYAVDASLRDSGGRTALIHAVAGGHVEFVREFADPVHDRIRLWSSKGLNDMNSLHNSLLGTFKLFNMTNIRVADNEGRTAYQLAVELGNQEIADLIRRPMEELIAKETAAIALGGSGVQYCYRDRGFAYQALGETEKAEADFQLAGNVVEQQDDENTD